MLDQGENTGKRLRWGDTTEPLYVQLLEKWESRWEKSFAGLWIPECPAEFFGCPARMIVMPKGTRPNMAFSRIEASGVKAWRYIDNLDCISSDRIANADHAFWVRDGQEADLEFRNMSADDCLAQLVSGINLEERLVLEEDYFLETGKHLNEKSITLCTGSRGPGGDVPHVHWHGDEVRVGWTGRGSAYPNVGTRQVVS